MAASAKGAAAAVFFVAALVLAVFIFTSVRIDGNTFDLMKSWKIVRAQRSDLLRPPSSIAPSKPITLYCPTANQSDPPTCPTASPRIPSSAESSSAASTCPDYFRWIHEDLRPWKFTGITGETVEAARKHATFRLVVRAGRAYVDTYGECFQTRSNFTLWGILQLLSRYPGRVPDVDLMFQCDDTPVVKAADYRKKAGPGMGPPPPLFRYCRDDETLDIPFPDWSFWGWVEVNIRPWQAVVEEMKEENRKVQWKDRRPSAYWKGNPWTSDRRVDLLKCNASIHKDSGALIYTQDWAKEVEQGFPSSNLSQQCIDRYKIFVEGRSWSVSNKYILGCDSPALFLTTHFYDFFTRTLQPGHHFWPIDENHVCKSIKFAVHWGNIYQKKAQAIGNAGNKFVREQLKMDYIYDYMLHLLIEYSKLLRYDPVIPDDAEELCLESMACAAEGTTRKFMLESMVRRASDYPPCLMPPPYTAQELMVLHAKKVQAVKKIERMEQYNGRH